MDWEGRTGRDQIRYTRLDETRIHVFHPSSTFHFVVDQSHI